MTAPRAGRAPDVPWQTAVDGLQRAAKLIDPTGRDVVELWLLPPVAGPGHVELPAELAAPMHQRLLSVAASIGLAHSLVGRAVAHDLELAGRLLGEDLLHPDPDTPETTR